jgi:ribosomal protein S12 methylthiotransferase
MEEQAVVSYTINQSLIGSTQEILIEGESEISDFPYIGRCRRQAPDIDGITYVKGKNLTIGNIILCRITAGGDYDLFAEVVTP